MKNKSKKIAWIVIGIAFTLAVFKAVDYHILDLFTAVAAPIVILKSSDVKGNWKSWVIANLAIALSVGYGAVDSTLKGFFTITPFVVSISFIVEAVRIWRLHKQAEQDQKYWGGWYKGYDWPDGPDGDPPSNTEKVNKEQEQ